jgi:hypothetical protein
MRIPITLLLTALAGCTLDGQQKTACNGPSDCLDGYACAVGQCVRQPDGGVTLVDASQAGGDFGEVQALAPATAGVTAFPDSYTLAGVTTATGGLGCAMLADEGAAPGTDTAVAYAKIDKGESGDTRCPAGSYAIMNDPSYCASDPFTGVRPGCAVYRRWDTAGTKVANRRAIGGYVTIQNTFVSTSDQRCDVDFSLRFAGGVTIGKTFSFHYNPLAPAEAFCVPQ